MKYKEIIATLDGRKVYGWLSGEGKPVVILDAGLGDSSEIWLYILPEMSRLSTVLTYDRAGMGQSEQAPASRTCKDIVSDLRNLLRAGDILQPCVLVAHSWSGINARWYANNFPEEIAGMVLVDAVNEKKYDRFANVMLPDQADRMWQAVRDPSKNDETIDRITSMEQVKSAGITFNFPLAVLTRNSKPANTSDEPNPLDLIETELQAEFLKLSTNSRQFTAKNNDHYIQYSEPELVISATRWVVDQVRNMNW